MKRIVKITLFFGGIAGGAAILIGIWHVLHPGVEPAKPLAGTTATPARPTGNLGDYTGAWSAKGGALPASSGPTPQGKRENMMAIRDLRAKVENDPAALQDVIRRYANERDPQARAMLRGVLATINKPEMLVLAKTLLADTDAAKRKEGLELLQAMPGQGGEVRGAIRQLLATEQAPAVLVQALAALKPAAVDPVEARAIIVDLERFIRNPDAAVRRQGIFQLGMWARNGEAIDSLSAALFDQSPEVKQAAIFALGLSSVRPDSVKTALLNILANPAEARQTRDSALQALDRFQLTKEEEVLYRQVRSQIHGY